jgi:hypothetical protein
MVYKRNTQNAFSFIIDISVLHNSIFYVLLNVSVKAIVKMIDKKDLWCPNYSKYIILKLNIK